MVPILLGLAAWYPAVVGLGAPLLALSARARPHSEDNLTWSALAGMAVLSVIVNALNFFTSIRPAVALALFVVGWGLAVVGQRRWKLFGSLTPFVAGLAGLLLVTLAWSAAQSPFNYETGLYQLPSVKWLTHSQVPLGLANLLGQFGFNSSWFSFAAALELPFLEGKSTFLANPLMLLVYGMAIGFAMRRFNRPELVTPASGFLALNVVPWLSLTMGVDLSSLSSDLPVMVLTLLSTYKCLSQWETGEVTMSAILEQYWLALFAISIKLSALPLLLTVLLLLLKRYARRTEAFNSWREAGALVKSGVAASLCVFGVWSARSIALSGCAVFPIVETCVFSLRWATPSDQVQANANYVTAWARLPWEPEAPALSGWDWLGPWLERTFTPAGALISASILFLGAGLIWLARRQSNPDRSRSSDSYLAVLAMPLAGLGFWFATAPAVRFGEGYFWSIGLLVLGGGVGRFCREFRLRRFGRLLLAGGALALAFLIAVWPLMAPRGWGADPPWITNEAELRLGRPALLWRWPALPQVVVAPHPTANGGRVYVPTSFFACWDAPLPCTWALNPQLKVQPTGAPLPSVFYFEP